MKYTQLLEAISEIEKWRINRQEMVILAPLNTMARMIAETDHIDDWYDGSNNPQFHGILVVEDEQITKVVVKSLISDHRVEVWSNQLIFDHRGWKLKTEIKMFDKERTIQNES